MKVTPRHETFIDVELDHTSQQALRLLFERTPNFPSLLLPLAEAVGWEDPAPRPAIYMKAKKSA